MFGVRITMIVVMIAMLMDFASGQCFGCTYITDTTPLSPLSYNTLRSNVFNGTQPSNEGCTNSVSIDEQVTIDCGQGTTLTDCVRGFNGGDYSDLSSTFAWNRTSSVAEQVSVVFRFDQQINISRITMFAFNSQSNSIIVPNVRLYGSNDDSITPSNEISITPGSVRRTGDGRRRWSIDINDNGLQFQYLRIEMSFYDDSEWIFLNEVEFCGNTAPYNITQPSTDNDVQIVSPTATMATLTCSINVTIPSTMTVTWLHNGTIIMTPPNEVLTAGSTTTLVIRNPQPSDAGVYRCVFNDSNGSGWVLRRSIVSFIGSIAVMFNQTMYSVDEDSGPAQPVLVLSGTSSMDIMVTVTDTEGSSTGGGVDYGSGPYTVTILAGMTSVPFDFPIINDMILEDDENFTITIDPSLPTGVTVGTPNQATVTIVDEDTMTVRFAYRTSSVSESDGFTILTVVKEGDAEVPVTVTVITSDGNAIAGDAYRSTTTTVTIAAGQTSVDVPVLIIDDNCREEDKTFNGELTVAPGQPSVILGTPDHTIITIVDDDESIVQFINSPYLVEESIGIYNVCLSILPACPLGATVTLVTAPKDAESGSDYVPVTTTVTFAPDQMIACVEMNNIIDDSVPEGPECFSLVITVPPGSGLVPGDSANVTIIDTDPGGDNNIRFFNDTIIGDPLYEVPLNMISNDTLFPEVTSLCYEIHGEAGRIFNLISDGCVQVNANYSAMDIPENGIIISQIGVLAYDNASGCAFIMVGVSDCVPVVNGVRYDTAVYNVNGVTARRRNNRARITVPNCAGENDDLVFWVVCQEFNNQRMIKFQVLRGSALQPDSHGLLGQFWNIPVTATGPLDSSSFNNSDAAYSVEVNPPQSPARSFVAELYRRTWERTLKPCLYAGNSQGGPISEISDDASVVEGEYFEYEVTDGIFGTSFTYNRLQARPCPRQ